MSFLPPGTRLGKYEIIRGVAVGGMAELYLARAAAVEEFDRLVALKRILPQFAADEEFVRMFLDEARLTAKLQHPNIAQVYDIGLDTKGLFFTMEFIHGENVQTLLRTADIKGRPVPLGHAIAIARGVAEGLHAAHEKAAPDGRELGIVHRDVSPSNVVVSFDGNIKLIDFGVAKARGRHTKTKSGTIKGKVSYMSPEQCRGEALDRRSDVFALGIVLYELTTTQKLFVADNEFALIKQIAYQDVPRPSERFSDYPPDLEAILMRALSRNIGRRYQSAREVADDLEAFARKHSLDTSATSLSAYMQSEFADSFRNWETLLVEKPLLKSGGSKPRGKRGVQRKRDPEQATVRLPHESVPQDIGVADTQPLAADALPESSPIAESSRPAEPQAPDRATHDKARPSPGQAGEISKAESRPVRNMRTVDSGSLDIESVDIESVDIESVDIESVDLESVDIESVDSGSINLESADLELIESGSRDQASIKPRVRYGRVAVGALAVAAACVLGWITILGGPRSVTNSMHRDVADAQTSATIAPASAAIRAAGDRRPTDKATGTKNKGPVLAKKSATDATSAKGATSPADQKSAAGASATGAGSEITEFTQARTSADSEPQIEREARTKKRRRRSAQASQQIRANSSSESDSTSQSRTERKQTVWDPDSALPPPSKMP